MDKRNPTASPDETRASLRARYIGPSNTRGSSISVSDDGGFGMPRRRIRFDYDDALNVAENKHAAAQAWFDKHNTGARVVSPGFSFDGDTFFTWGFDQ